MAPGDLGESAGQRELSLMPEKLRANTVAPRQGREAVAVAET